MRTQYGFLLGLDIFEDGEYFSSKVVSLGQGEYNRGWRKGVSLKIRTLKKKYKKIKNDLPPNHVVVLRDGGSLLANKTKNGKYVQRRLNIKNSRSF